MLLLASTVVAPFGIFATAATVPRHRKPGPATNFPNFTMVLELILFLLVLLLIARFVLPSLRRAMTDHKQHISDMAAAADAARAVAQSANHERIPRAARERSRAIVDEAVQAGEQIVSQYRRRGEGERESILAVADEAIQNEEEPVHAQLLSSTEDLGRLAAERVLDAPVIQEATDSERSDRLNRSTQSS